MEKPKICPYCGQNVVLTSNKEIYGKEYGNGKCYLCRNCRASVGLHNGKGNRPLGILATNEMKQLKMECHKKFDRVWKSKRLSRFGCYARLSKKLGIPTSQCHFGYFDTAMLNKALVVLEDPNWYKDEPDKKAKDVISLVEVKEEKDVTQLENSLIERLELDKTQVKSIVVDAQSRKDYRNAKEKD